MNFQMNISDLIRTAEAEATKDAKCCAPDDDQFWDKVQDYWEDQEESDEHPQPESIAMLKVVYPRTQHKVAVHGVSTTHCVKVTDVRRKLSQDKQKAYERKEFRQAELWYNLRHNAFIKQLTGPAKDIYQGIFNNNAQSNWYYSLCGYQKTNYVVNELFKNLFDNMEKKRIKTMFEKMSQRDNQTFTEYIHTLEKRRSNLESLGMPVNDEEMKTKILFSLNDLYTNASLTYDADSKSLSEVKQYLVRVERQLQKRRYRFKQRSNLGKRKYDASTGKKETQQHPDRKDLKTVKCYKCNQMGHYAHQCPKKQKVQESKTPNPINAIDNESPAEADVTEEQELDDFDALPF